MEARRLLALATHSSAGAVERDAMLALAGTPRAVALYMRARYMADRTILDELHAAAFARALGLASRQWRGFDVRQVFHVERLALVAARALDESLSPMICGRCKGRGHITRLASPAAHCTICRGTGRRAPSDAARARACGISRARWSRVWGARFAQLERAYAEWDHAGRRNMGLRLAN